MKQPAQPRRAELPVGYTGVDYVNPSPMLTGCPEWSWLQAGCYTNSSLTAAHLSPQQLFASDLIFIKAQHLGSFQRVYISLDQLMRWNLTTGYAGYDKRALANVDDLLHRAAAAGIKLDLVLLVYVGNSYVHSFHPEALDGHHSLMRANYLRAMHDFVAHVAADPVDAGAIAVMDLQTEAYYQLETYMYTPAHLGRWDYRMPNWPQSTQCYALGNTLCTGGAAGHGCVSSSGLVDTTCIDVNIIEPWLADLYATAKAAAPRFLFTISDTERLLTTSTGAHTSQRWWVSMYPVDVYDVHPYSNTPWTESARWATGLRLPKPWFVGETGCRPGNVNCTYSGTAALPIDRWWVQHMAGDGARAVLVENQSTAWTYVYTDDQWVASLTPIGHLIAATTQAPPAIASDPPPATPTSTPTRTPTPTATPSSTPTNTPTPISTTVFATGFDSQAAGALKLGGPPDQFGGVCCARPPSVERGVAASAPNGLVASLAGGGSSFAYTQYPAGYRTHDLRFRLLLGANMHLPTASYLVLARTAPTATTLPGKVDLIMNGSGALFLDYFTGTGARQYLWASGAPLAHGIWHTLELRESVGTHTGSLQLLLDGQTIGQASGLNLGTGGVGYFAVGDVGTPQSTTTAGRLYVDDVVTMADPVG